MVHCVLNEGIHLIPDKLAALKNFPMINCFHHFLPALSATLSLLYTSFMGGPKDLKWGRLQEAAFCNAKNTLSIITALNFPLPYAPLLLFTNTSWVAIGTVLEHVDNSLTSSLSFFS
ncbi:uncharacterized protein [Palaemon carinicauda]|uniref:uncharacterized protein n=1 Tax=Palaemon carinicauda TaxID=392227 RepID=UPI0035B5EBCC